MSGVFVDTNTLIYADQVASTFHTTARRALAQLEQDGADLWISRQVLREFLAVVIRLGAAGAPVMSRAEAAAAVEGLADAYLLAEDGPETTSRLIGLVRRFPMGGRQIHDANIAATMLAHGVTRLLTFNASDFRRFEPLIGIIAL